MIAFRFGSDDRKRFAAYYPAPTELRKPVAVLLCNPFGQEAIRSHRLYRILAERLARRGIGVLRFDYLGTGDSDGDDESVSMASWCVDIVAADQELRSRSGCVATTWLGLRLGALAALMASQSAVVGPQRLILHEPVIDGSDYLDELRQTHMRFLAIEFGRSWNALAGHAGRPPDGPLDEALGFPIPAVLRNELLTLDLATRTWPHKIPLSLIGDGDSTSVAAFLEVLSHAQYPHRWEDFRSTVPWDSDDAMNSAVIPNDLIELLREQVERAA